LLQALLGLQITVVQDTRRADQILNALELVAPALCITLDALRRFEVEGVPSNPAAGSAVGHRNAVSRFNSIDAGVCRQFIEQSSADTAVSPD
jgi:hypothetical protein